MKFSTLLFPLTALTLTSAQSTSSFSDPKTGITFQAAAISANLTFGIALDNTPSADFIGTIVGKGTTGYSGFSLGGAMVAKLLIAAWPTSTGNLISSFRLTPKFQSPPEVTGAYSMHPIANGTYVNSTHYSFTFLCKGCILADGTTFAQTDNTTVLGWAYSTAPPTTPANHSTAMPKHGFNGNFGVNLSGARSRLFKGWASMAQNSAEYNFPRPRAVAFES